MRHSCAATKPDWKSTFLLARTWANKGDPLRHFCATHVPDLQNKLRGLQSEQADGILKKPCICLLRKQS